MVQQVLDNEDIQPFVVGSYNQADAYANLVTKHGEECPVFCAMITYMLVYGENAAGAERGFSLMNRVRTKQRNSLSHFTLRDIMTIIKCPIDDDELDCDSYLINFSKVELDGGL